MRTNSILNTLIAASLFTALSLSPVSAQEEKAGHSHERAEQHGGEVAMTKEHHFEVVWMPNHVMVYVYDGRQNPLDAVGVTGEVTFKFKGGKSVTKELKFMDVSKMKDMHKDGDHDHKMEHKKDGDHDHKMKHDKEGDHDHKMGKKGMKGMDKEMMKAMHKLMANQNHFMAKIDLEGVKEGEVKATFTLKGLPGTREKEATFTVKNRKMKHMMGGMHKDGGHHKKEKKEHSHDH